MYLSDPVNKSLVEFKDTRYDTDANISDKPSDNLIELPACVNHSVYTAPFY